MILNCLRFLSPMRVQLNLLILAAATLSGCGGSRMEIDEMTAAQHVAFGAPSAVGSADSQYRIGAGDKLNVRVFQVPDLSLEDLVVDASGALQLPLIGAVQSAGRTPGELSSDIEQRLAVRYLRDPKVTVTVTEAASQKVTLDGAVTKPGVYEMRGSTSLIQAVAMAEGPARTADLSKVAVFRNIEGVRSVALFDLDAIRQGRAEDPQILGDDIIVVDSSRVNAAIREVLGAAPLLSVFRPF